MLRDSDLLRAAPVQARSNLRLAALLDAAATLIQRHGYEELTTAAVAKQAGASIGTVYRYFEDRIVLLKALATRNFERTVIAFRSVFTEAKPGTVSEAFDVLFDVYLDLFRSEPGYRSLRMGDVLDIRPLETETASRRSCEMLAARFEVDFGVKANEQNVQALETGFVTMDALLARAFSASEKGDPAFIDAARAAGKSAISALR
jgi:AcrR family transcriptional regulator